MGARGSVAQGPRAAGVASDRAAHSALVLTRRVGCEEESVWHQRALQIADAHARFHAHGACHGIDVEYAIESAG